MKARILRALRQSDGYVSGQELCEQLQVSRTAVWKKIRQLQEEGYEIEAVTNRGYRILSTPENMSAEEIESRVQTGWIARSVEYLERIDSTNQYAKKRAEEKCPEGLLVVADEQTMGKGRSGRSWSTPPGTNIAMSLVLRPALAPERISMVTLVMGLAVARACRQLYGLEAGIKWPNDIVVNGRKLCGILTEMCCEILQVGYIVIGVGINANLTEFPEEIRKTATSLELELGHPINRAELIAAVMEHFEEAYEAFIRCSDLSALQEEYNALLVNRDRAVRVLEPGHEYTGTAQGIDAAGNLLVRRDDGELTRVYAGEVSVRGIYGYI